MTDLVLSSFPGLGFLDKAFEDVHYCVVRGPDLLWGGDARRFHPPIGKFAGVIGGPPCQHHCGLGQVNKARWGEDSVLPDMIPEFVRIVEEADPDWFTMENVPEAPIPEPAGYTVHSEILCDDWFGGETQRPRRITFGGDACVVAVWKRLLHSQQTLAPPNPAPVILSSGQSGKGGPRASIERMARSQGYDPAWFEHSPFTTTELRRAIANGVPLAMGRAIANAVRGAVSMEMAA